MKKLQPYEVKLIGKWKSIGDKIVGNDVCDRIEQLTENYLNKVSTDSSGWDILYQDPEDGRYWELTYPESHLHGGGPPILECISGNIARDKYNC